MKFKRLKLGDAFSMPDADGTPRSVVKLSTTDRKGSLTNAVVLGPQKKFLLVDTDTEIAAVNYHVTLSAGGEL